MSASGARNRGPPAAIAYSCSTVTLCDAYALTSPATWASTLPLRRRQLTKDLRRRRLVIGRRDGIPPIDVVDRIGLADVSFIDEGTLFGDMGSGEA